MKGFKLYAFNILSDHVHLLFKPNDKYNISQIMFSLKKQFAHDANRILRFNKIYVPSQNVHNHPLVHLHNFINKFKVSNPFSNTNRFQWQRSYFDHFIRSEYDFICHYKYTVDNHLKHNENGHSNDHNYSSINFPNLIDTY